MIAPKAFSAQLSAKSAEQSYLFSDLNQPF
jgi:hypothetical protein